MNTNNISIEIIDFINQRIKVQEDLNECLATAKALVCVSLGDDFLNFERSTIAYYLNQISNLLTKAHELGIEQFELLLNNRAIPQQFL